MDKVGFSSAACLETHGLSAFPLLGLIGQARHSQQDNRRAEGAGKQKEQEGAASPEVFADRTTICLPPDKQRSGFNLAGICENISLFHGLPRSSWEQGRIVSLYI